MHDEGLLDQIGLISAAAEEFDGVSALDEATWLALRHPQGHDITIQGGQRSDFALIVDDHLSLVVHPEFRGRGKATSRLGELLIHHHGPLTAWSHGNHPAAAALARRNGFTRVRDLWVLRRSAALPLGEVALPEGLAVRGYQPADRDDLLRVNAAAFAAHPEQGGMDEDDLAARMAEPWYDPTDLLLVTGPGGRLLGFHWTKVHSAESGEIYVLAIAPEGQGRGLGRLIAVAGLRHLAARGVDEVHLFVESDNAAATALYSALGFSHADVDTHVMYRREATT